MTSLYRNILEKSAKVNWEGKSINPKTILSFPVAKSHKRYAKLKKYSLEFKDFKKIKLNKSDLIIVDKFLVKALGINVNAFPFIEQISSSEGGTKTLNFAERILIKNYKKKIRRVVAIGGGVILDLGSYLAEQIKVDLNLVPTTIIAMCDASTGGKVRMNFVDAGRYIKHYYKSFYEPNNIYVDFSLLKSLTHKQISIGLGESIKHAFAQSPKFVSYMLSNKFDPFNDLESLKTAIIWTADLKRIALTVDPEESTKGSHKIIYLAHNYANKIEEESLFKVSHGEAVEKGMLLEFAKNPKKLKQLKGIYDKLNITY